MIKNYMSTNILQIFRLYVIVKYLLENFYFQPTFWFIPSKGQIFYSWWSDFFFLLKINHSLKSTFMLMCPNIHLSFKSSFWFSPKHPTFVYSKKKKKEIWAESWENQRSLNLNVEKRWKFVIKTLANSLSHLCTKMV